jgi:Mn-dependent DtxR family transcriptional regulator
MHVARHLNVKASSATIMLRKLGELGLVSYQRRHSVGLTAEGEGEAVRILGRRRVLQRMVEEVLRIPAIQAQVWIAASADYLTDDLAREFEDSLARHCTQSEASQRLSV